MILTGIACRGGEPTISREEAESRWQVVEAAAVRGQPLDFAELAALFGDASPFSRTERADMWRPLEGKIASVRGRVVSIGKAGLRSSRLVLRLEDGVEVEAHFTSLGATLDTLVKGAEVRCSGFLGTSLDKGLRKARLE